MNTLKKAALTGAVIFLFVLGVSSLRYWTDAPSKRSATFALEQYVTHVKHPRTGLCFMVANDSRGLSFTNVPCTLEVLREIARAR